MAKFENIEDIMELLKKDEKDLTQDELLQLHSFTIATIASDMKLMIQSVNNLDERLKNIENKLKE